MAGNTVVMGADFLEPGQRSSHEVHPFGSPEANVGGNNRDPSALQITNYYRPASGLVSFGNWFTKIAYSSPLHGPLGVLNLKLEP
jgi:hypothetical protein